MMTKTNKDYTCIWSFNRSTRWGKKKIPRNVLSLPENGSFICGWHQQPLECTLPGGWVTSPPESWRLLATGLGQGFSRPCPPSGSALWLLPPSTVQITSLDPCSTGYKVVMAKGPGGNTPGVPDDSLTHLRRNWEHLGQAEGWFQS